MIKWAEREVQIACKKENPDRKEGEWDYGCSCYESALKAYKSLCEDNHSGYSFSLTKNILNRLMNSLPLTPITDEDFFIPTEGLPKDESEWLRERGLDSTIQCPRMPSLFRYNFLDGRIEYKDVERCFCYDKENPDGPTWSNGFMSEQLDKLFPITMPYYPTVEKYKLECSECLFDPRAGDFDTIALWSITTPEGKRIEVNKFWKENSEGGITEIEPYEWEIRKESEARRKDIKARFDYQSFT